MRIISLEAENFKRLRAVRIEPTGNVIEVTGDNSEGKTSTLDAIWAALGGAAAEPVKPVHTGQEKAEVRLVLGENGEPKYKVTKRFKLREDGSTRSDLIVESPDGAQFQKAQTLLSSWLGDYTFDPLALLSMKDEDQIATLRRFVPGFDFAAAERANKDDYAKRRDINRDAAALRTQAGAITVPAEISARVDTEALEGELARAAEHNASVAQRQARRDAAKAELQRLDTEIARLTEQRDALQQQIDNAEALPALIEVDDVQTKLAEGRAANRVADEVQRRRELEKRAKALEDESAALTKAMLDRHDAMQKAVTAAKMPVKGLGFGDGFVTLNGEPFSQASKAEQIRTSMAIAASMNPTLRVARIADGSLLDRKSWAILHDYAEANDLQVWIETVTPHTSTAILIEDGGVAGLAVENPQPPADDVGDVL